MGVKLPDSCRRFWRAQCLPVLRQVAGPPTAVLMILLLTILLVAKILLWLPAGIVGIFTWPITANFGLIVEHGYSMTICKLHVTLGRWCRRRSRHAYHSRFADLRVDVPLLNGGRASVHLIPCLSDNFAYLIVDATAKPPRPSCLVDPCDAYAVFDALPAIKRIHYNGEELDVQAILTTHRHWDHQGGNRDMPRLLPSIRRIYGGAADRVLGCTHELQHGQQFDVGALRWQVIAAPGHTRGSVLYHLLGAAGRDCLMTGDALFCGGCGAPFEEYCGECSRNLLTITRECSDETLIFPGHEYTSRLLQQVLAEKMSHTGLKAPGSLMALAGARFMTSHRRKLGLPCDRLPTVPVSLGEERRLNPKFGYPLHRYARMVLSVLEARLHAQARRSDSVTTFRAVAGETVEALGFTTSPPPVVIVKARTPQSWAENAGITLGDELTSLNGRPVNRMTKADFGKLMLQRPLALDFVRSSEKARKSDKLQVDSGGEGTKVAEPVVLSHDRLPTANPFTTLYRLDFERICTELENGKLAGAEAAAELRAARDRLEDEALHCCEKPRRDGIPNKQELREALCVLGVRPEFSIGREAAELAAVPVCLPWLRANLIGLCDRERISAATAALNSCWEAASTEESAPVSNVVDWLTLVRVPQQQGVAASPPISDGGSSAKASLGMDSAGPKPSDAPPPPSPAVEAPRRPVGRHRRCCRRLACSCRCCSRKLEDISIYDELLQEPKHDIARCPVCTNTFFGVASGTCPTSACGEGCASAAPRLLAEAQPLQPGLVVCIHGLQAARHLNGLIGACVERLDSGGDMWAVQLESGEVKSIKAENLMISLGQTRINSRGDGDRFGPKITIEPPARLPSVESSAAHSLPSQELTDRSSEEPHLHVLPLDGSTLHLASSTTVRTLYSI